MKNKINKVKRELRGVKKNSHAIERLIKYQGLRFTRIRALEALPREKKRDAIIENEKKLINALGIDKLVLENEEMEKKYKEALNAPHAGFTLYLKCPECGKRTWCKKVLGKK